MGIHKDTWAQMHGKGSKGKKGGKCCLSCIFPLLGFLVAGCILSIPLIYLINQLVFVPAAVVSQPENIASAIERSNSYFSEKKNWPMPQDVVLDEAVIEFAKSKAFDDRSGEYFPVRSCIAAADLNNIGRAELCALLSTVDSGWRAETEAESFISAMGTARWLISLGYDQDIPLEYEYIEGEDIKCNNSTCLSVWDFYNHIPQLFLRYPNELHEWKIVNNVSIRDVSEDDIFRWPAMLIKFWTLENLDYKDVMDDSGTPVVYDQSPKNPLPILSDGDFVHPVPNGRISGYQFDKYYHRGTDFSKSPPGWAYAAHNGEVVVSAWSKLGYGNMTFIHGKTKDGKNICSLYAHGKRLYLKKGEHVLAGDGVFPIGNTGNSFGSHLHFELKIGGSGKWCSGGTYVNPVKVLPPQ